MAEKVVPLNALTDAIADLMVAFGPDGHNDGAEILAYFVDLLLAGHDVQEALEGTQAIGDALQGARREAISANSRLLDLRLSARR